MARQGRIGAAQAPFNSFAQAEQPQAPLL